MAPEAAAMAFVLLGSLYKEKKENLPDFDTQKICQKFWWPLDYECIKRKMEEG